MRAVHCPLISSMCWEVGGGCRTIASLFQARLCAMGVSVLQLDGWSGCCAEELAGRDEGAARDSGVQVIMNAFSKCREG